MIVFTCSHCGKGYRLSEEFAGRATNCSACKRPMVVPIPDQGKTLGPDAPVAPMETVAPEGVGGIGHAGSGAGITLTIRHPIGIEAALPRDPIAEVLALHAANGERYQVLEEIARGGMGVVRRGFDCKIRREVALKYLLDHGDAGKRLRFEEEAQITGQLEHPNIVPVHELGIDAKNEHFFSMKMVRGRSLNQILDGLRAKVPEFTKEYTLGKLVNIVVGVSNALSYAHQFGVVHRDLKPANIMVGEHGEVYVMDWGLAKVLPGGEDPPLESESDSPDFTIGAPEAANVETGIKSVTESATEFVPPPGAVNDSASGSSSSRRISTSRSGDGDSASGSSGSGKVVTSRQADSAMTIEGTIMGTPMYMPPEQAQGQINQIGRRSDIYSLGAILYETLALLPPVEKEGGFLAVLQRVVQGQIVAPEKRNPARAREGKIPAELSAIAMKALAKRPARRYATMIELRTDIEWFQEGRSVSAKEDSKREMLVKFVKRNKAFSAATAVSVFVVVVILLASSWINWRARTATQQAYDDYLKAQEKVKERTRKAVPALVEAARLAVEKHNFPAALTQASLALEYDPDALDALLLRGQLLIVQQDYKGAIKDFERYLKLRPSDKAVRELAKLCGKPDPAEKGNLRLIARIFDDQKAPVLAEGILKKNAFEYQYDLLEQYKRRLDKAWTGKEYGTKYLRMEVGLYSLNLTNCKDVSNLAPLLGMTLTKLQLNNCRSVQELTPLEGMTTLTTLELNDCSLVKDLTPLRGLPLTALSLARCASVKDLAPVVGMPLESLNLFGCGGIRDLAPVKDMQLKSLDLGHQRVEDLAMFRAMPLNYLALESCTEVRDLTPLKDMPLETLKLTGCTNVRDLTPLANLKLHYLGLENCIEVRDLTPLNEMPLVILKLTGCTNVRDLTPLANLNLREITLPAKTPAGMEVLRAMKSLNKINGKRVEIFWDTFDSAPKK